MTIGAALRALGVSSIVVGAGAAAQHGGAPAAAVARAREAAPSAGVRQAGGDRDRATVDAAAPVAPFATIINGRAGVWPAYVETGLGADGLADPAAAAPAGASPAAAGADASAMANVLVSHTPGGAGGDSSSRRPSVSADGRYVAFSSFASDLVPNDNNNREDVFVLDTQTGVVERVSVSSSGNQANDRSFEPSISGDGQYVVFTSRADNLVGGDTNGYQDIFLRDRASNTTVRVNVDRFGNQAMGDNCQGCPDTSAWPSISANGRFVAFFSSATNLMSTFDLSFHIYVKDMETGLVERVSLRDGRPGTQSDGDFTGYLQPSISADGRFVAFFGAPFSASNHMDPTMLPPQTGPSPGSAWFQPFVRDRQTNTTRQVARTPDNHYPDNGVPTDMTATVSDNGARAAFTSLATNLVPDDTNDELDVFVRTLSPSATIRASLSPTGQQLSVPSRHGVLSANARFVAYQAGNSGPVVRRDLDMGVRRTDVSQDVWGRAQSASQPAISSSGRWIAFQSSYGPFTPATPNSQQQVYLRDRTIDPNPAGVDGYVYDADTGHPIDGAHVRLEEKSGTTDASGYFLIDELPTGEFEISASAPGHHTKTAAVTLAGRSNARKTFRLKTVTDGTRPEVVEVRSFWSSPDRKTLFLDHVTLSQTFTATIDWHGRTPDRVVFITPIGEHNATFYALSGIWQCDLDMGSDFGVLTPSLLVRAISADNLVSGDYRVNMQVIPPPIDDPNITNALLPLYNLDALTYAAPATTLTLPGAGLNSGILPGNIPVVGDKPLKFGVSAQGGMSVKGDGTADFSASVGATTEEGATKVAGLSIGMTVSGGATAQYSEAQARWSWGGQLGVGASASLPAPPKPVQLVTPPPIPGIPWYWQGKIGLGLTTNLAITGVDDQSRLNAMATVGLDPFPSISATVGIGVAEGASIYGTAAGSIKASLTWSGGFTPTAGSLALAVSGTFGAQILGVYSYEIPILQYTFFTLSFGAPGDSAAIGGGRFGLTSRDYFERATRYAEFVANTAEPETPRVASKPGAADGAVSQTVVTPIELNVFNESKAALLALGNDLLMVWQKDDPTRTPTNRLELTWSYFTHATGMWSNPAPVADDATADLIPQLAPQPDGTILCAWQDLKEVLAEPLDPMDPNQVQAKFEEFKSKTEISAAVFNPVTQSWGPATRLTDNALYEHSPKPSVADDGTALVMWVSNAFGNEIGSVAQPNFVWAARRAMGAWQAPGVIAANVPSIIRSAAAIRPGNSGEAFFGYSADGDDDPATADDWELWSFESAGGVWSGPFRRTNNTTQDVGPFSACWGCWDSGWNMSWSKATEAGTKVHLGADGDQSDVVVELPYAGAVDLVHTTGPSERNYVVFQAQSEDLVDLVYAGWDPEEDEWTATAQRLTADRAMEVPTAVAMTSNLNLVVAYNKTVIGSEMRTVNVEDEEFEIEVPVREGTDLYVLRHAIHADLAISSDDIAMTPDRPLPGQQIDLFVTLHELGELAVWGGAFDVAFYNGDPNNGGVMLGDITRYPSTFPGGGGTGTMECNGLIFWPFGAQSLDIYVVVDPFNRRPDADRSNNVAHRVFALTPDMTVAQVTADTISPTDREIVARVQNTGSAESPATTCVIREEEQRGAALVTLQVPPLAPGAFADLPWVWPNSANLPGGSFALSASVDEENLIAEFDETNNATNAAANNNLPPTVPCPGDANGDGLVDFLDLNIVLSAYGTSGPPGSIPGDLDDDGDCDFVDLNIVLSNYGTMC